MIDSQDVSEQELEVLRGDALSNNLCSSKWIIKTLMSLCEIDKHGWTKELEDQLCILWDLSMEGEVVSHLISYDFPNIAKNTLMTSDEPRLIEIILGIIGNVGSSDEAFNTILRDRELVTQILRHLTSADSLILIQLMRILKSIFWQITAHESEDFLTAYLTECEFFGDSIIFILKSSTNDDLLTGTMNMLESVCNVDQLVIESFWEKLFKIDDLFSAMLESFRQVISRRKTSQFEWKFAEHWLGVLTDIMDCTSGFKSTECKFSEFKIDKTDEKFLKLMEIMYRILKPCKKSYNLYPIREGGANMIYDITHILLCLRCCDVNDPRLDCILATIFFSLKTVSESDSKNNQDPEELIAELLDYLNRYWLHMIKICTSKQIVVILRLCKREVREYLISFVQSHPKATLEALHKMKKVVKYF
ncbi:protein saal1-like isoform X2 [Temnothorax nylanderi]